MAGVQTVLRGKLLPFKETTNFPRNWTSLFHLDVCNSQQ